MKAKVMNLMPLEGFGVKKSWGVMGGLRGGKACIRRSATLRRGEVGSKSRGKTAYGEVSFSHCMAHF